MNDLKIRLTYVMHSECTICYTNHEDKTNVSCSTCKHTMCKQCFKKHISCLNLSCPYCREQFDCFHVLKHITKWDFIKIFTKKIFLKETSPIFLSDTVYFHQKYYHINQQINLKLSFVQTLDAEKQNLEEMMSRMNGHGLQNSTRYKALIAELNEIDEQLREHKQFIYENIKEQCDIYPYYDVSTFTPLKQLSSEQNVKLAQLFLVHLNNCMLEMDFYWFYITRIGFNQGNISKKQFKKQIKSYLFTVYDFFLYICTVSKNDAQLTEKDKERAVEVLGCINTYLAGSDVETPITLKLTTKFTPEC